MRGLGRVEDIWWKCSRKIVLLREMSISNMIEIQALIELLMEKEFVTRDGLRGKTGKMSSALEFDPPLRAVYKQGRIIPVELQAFVGLTVR